MNKLVSQHAKLKRHNQLLIVLGVGFAVLISGLTAAVNPQLAVALLFCIAVFAGFVRSTSFAVCAYVVITMFPTIQSTGPLPITPSKLLGAALIVLAAVMALTARSRGDIAWMRNPVTMIGFVVLLGVATASLGWAVTPSVTVAALQRLFSNALAFLAIGMLVVSIAQVRLIYFVILVSAVATSLWGVIANRTLVERFIGGFADPNEYAAMIVPAIVIAYILLLTTRGTIPRLAIGGAMVLCGWGLIMSQSRGGFVAAGAAIAVLFLTAISAERVRIAIGLMVVAAAVGIFLVSPAGGTLMNRFSEEGSSGRTDLWEVAVAEFKDKPITGVGLGNYTEVSSQYLDADIQNTDLFLVFTKAAHSSYFEMLAELGIIGIISYLTFLGGCAGAALLAIRRARHRQVAGASTSPLIHYTRGAVAALIGTLSSSIFLSNQYQQLTWILLALCLVTAALLHRDCIAQDPNPHQNAGVSG